MSVAVLGIGWISAAGMGCGGAGRAFSMPAGELPPIARREIFPEPDQRFGRLDPYAKAGLAAVTFALRDAGLEAWREKRPIGIVAATVSGCLETDVAYFSTVLPQGGALASPNLFAYTLPNSFLGEAAIRFGLTGPTFVLTDGDPAGLAALTVAGEMIREGECSLVLAGLCDVAPSGGWGGVVPSVPPGAVFFLLGAEAGAERPAYGVLSLGAEGEIGYNNRTVESVAALATACLAQKQGERNA